MLLVISLHAQDKTKQRKFHWQSVGAYFQDGTFQFFDSYNRDILLTNARSGLPIYNDWTQYSGPVHLPVYQQAGVHAGWVDTTRGLKVRLGLTWYHREDSLTTTRDFAFLDTIVGRNASEVGDFYGFTAAAMKQTRKVLGFVRFYGGARVETGFSPRSRIRFYEFAYDISEESFLDFNTFSAVGKPRFSLYGSALLGFETVFFHRLGFFAEVQSGIGLQVVVREPGYGFGKNSFSLGLNYYLFDYQRRKPDPVPLEEYDPYLN